MSTAQLHIEQRQITVQIQEHVPKPIEVPLPLGGSYYQQSRKITIIQGETSLPFSGHGPYPLHIGNRIYNFTPRRPCNADLSCWEGEKTSP